MRIPLPIDLGGRVRRWCAAQQLDVERTLDELNNLPGDFLDNVEHKLLTGAWQPPPQCEMGFHPSRPM